MSLSFKIHVYLRKKLAQQLKAVFAVNIIVLVFVNLLKKTMLPTNIFNMSCKMYISIFNTYLSTKKNT